MLKANKAIGVSSIVLAPPGMRDDKSEEVQSLEKGKPSDKRRKIEAGSTAGLLGKGDNKQELGESWATPDNLIVPVLWHNPQTGV